MKLQIEFNDWELLTIIRHLEHHQKWDRSTILNSYQEMGLDVPAALIESLDTVDGNYTTLIAKLETARMAALNETKETPAEPVSFMAPEQPAVETQTAEVSGNTADVDVVTPEVNETAENVDVAATPAEGQSDVV